MSVRRQIRDRGESERFRLARRTVTEVCFGDSTGVTLFLAFLAWLVVAWRFGTFFNDVGLLVPALERLASGHVSLGSGIEIEHLKPGMYYRDGQVYARNYGQLVFSLPAYWFVNLIGGAAFRALLILGWSGIVIVVASRVGSHYGRRRLGTLLGAAVGLPVLVANGLTFKPLVSSQLSIVALQLTSILAGALVGVFMYRILARQYGRKIGVFGGAVTVFASPVGFWASIPKRHTFAALFVVLALYSIVRSRDEEMPGRLGQAGFRAMAYASAGFLTWIHAPEGFTLFLAVAIIDILTAPRNDRRTLAVIAGALFLSLVPFFVTNYLVAGNPLEPPRFMPSFNGFDSLPGSEQARLEASNADGGVEAGGGDGAGSDGGGGVAAGDDGSSTGSQGSDPGEDLSDSPFAIDVEALLPAAFITLLQQGIGRYFRGIVLAIDEPGRLVTVFLRWGEQGYDPENLFFGGGTNLSVLESFPVAAAFVVAPIHYGIRIIRERAGLFERPASPADGFAVLFSLLLAALYLDKLPLKVMVTVRYLHPLYPLLVYAVFRQSRVRTLVTEQPRGVLAGYGVTGLGGTALVVSALLSVDATKGDVFQAFAIAALAAATAFGLASLAGRFDQRFDRVAGVSFGTAAGITTAFILVTSFVVLHFGPSALPIVESLSGDLRFEILT